MSAFLRVQAAVDLVMRYRRAFTFHWSHRDRAAGPRYRAAEAEFLPASLALIETPVSPTARITAGLLVSLVALAILWAVLAQVDVVVSAPGKVIPSSRIKTIASIDVASVRAIHVVEGQSVRAGDTLLELDAGVIEAERGRAEAQIDAARLEMARSRALIAAVDEHREPRFPPLEGIDREQYEDAKAHLAGGYLDYRAKLIQLDGEISRYARALPLAQDRAKSLEVLAKSRDVPPNTWSEKLQEAIDLEGELVQAQNARASLIAQTRRQALDSLAEARRVIENATYDAARASSHVRQLTLHAPVDGTVQELSVHTIGGVVPAAQPLMQIVPKDDTVEVDAYIQNKDIGFIREGQLVQVKVDAFDYTRHGMIQGNVVAVSKDAVEDERRGPIYRTTVRLSSSEMKIDGSAMALSPGMTVATEIKTGRRRIIEYILSPLVRHTHESLTER
jgi:hemolysin D